jgi:glutaconate CoA-transferase subunit A
VTTETYPQPRDKRMTEDEVVARLSSGMTIGIGGWGSRRKPMSLVRAILRSDLTDLHVVTFGGPEVGMLAAAGKLSKLTFAFVAPDVGPAAVLEPHFRAARQSGALDCTELDEGMLLLGLQAAAWRVPFLPTRVGLGSDLSLVNDGWATVTSPFPGPDGEPETLVAQPAIHLDAALVHLNVADERGNAAYTGPDPYFDDLMCEAATAAYVSAERVVASGDLLAAAGDLARLKVNRLFTDGVVEAPNGAHPTSCEPDHGRDEAFQKAYLGSAKDPELWQALMDDYLALPSEADYQAAIAARTDATAGDAK